MPSAPSRRALVASSPVSALARTPSLPLADAVGPPEDDVELGRRLGRGELHLAEHDLAGRAVDARSTSPSLTVMSPTVNDLPVILIASAPTTAGVPQPRATTAAWLTRPPRAVRMPWATIIPWTSSGLVSLRTRMTFSPRSAAARRRRRR